MSTDDSLSLIGVDTAGSLREQQRVATNEDRGLLQCSTAISAPSPQWTRDLLTRVQDKAGTHPMSVIARRKEARVG